MPQRRVLDDIECPGAFPHAGAGGKDDEVRSLQPSRELLQLDESRRYAPAALVGCPGLHLLQVVTQDRPDVLEVPGHPALGNPEQQLFGLLQSGIQVQGVVVSYAGYLSGGADQTPLDRGPLHNPSVILDVDCRGDHAHQVRQVGKAACLLVASLPRELVGDRREIDGFAAVVDGEHRREEAAVALPVEVVGLQEGGDLSHGLRVHEQAAQHGLFGLSVLGRKPVYGVLSVDVIQSHVNTCRGSYSIQLDESGGSAA